MNQYRCDNGCKYFEQHYCNFLHDRLANIEIVHIERVGCASHSDFQSERDKVLDIVADIINNRITELREGKPEYYIRFGEKNTFNELQATEGEFLLLRIREELQQAGEP